MVPLKIKKCLRVCCTEAINALVLVSNHEELPGFRGKKADHTMLDAGGILRLIYTDIGILLLKM